MLPALHGHPIAGHRVGLVAYCIMNFVVVPLSAAPQGALRLPVLVNGVLIHIFGVGLPAGWFALRPFAGGFTSTPPPTAHTAAGPP
jgi:hypothetical protein